MQLLDSLEKILRDFFWFPRTKKMFHGTKHVWWDKKMFFAVWTNVIKEDYCSQWRFKYWNIWRFCNLQSAFEIKVWFLFEFCSREKKSTRVTLRTTFAYRTRAIISTFSKIGMSRKFSKISMPQIRSAKSFNKHCFENKHVRLPQL